MPSPKEAEAGAEAPSPATTTSMGGCPSPSPPTNHYRSPPPVLPAISQARRLPRHPSDGCNDGHVNRSPGVHIGQHRAPPRPGDNRFAGGSMVSNGGEHGAQSIDGVGQSGLAFEYFKSLHRALGDALFGEANDPDALDEIESRLALYEEQTAKMHGFG